MTNDMIWEGNRYPVAAPEEVGIHSRSFLEFFDRIREERIELHSFHLIRRKKMALACVAKPFTENSPHRIYSAAKGIQCLAALFLVQEGKLSLNDRVVDVFKDYLPDKMDPKMGEMTIYHLLTMTNGHPRTGFYEMRKSDNWIKSFLSQPLLRQPGTEFEYNNGPPHLACCLPRVLTGQTMIEYLTPRFFEPLGMVDLCETCLDPANPTDLEPTTQCLSPLDFVKFALFFLQGGSWNGKQLLRSDLCNLVGKRHFPTKHASPDVLSTQYGFGLFCYGNSFGGYRFHGGYGQMAIVIPELDIACAYMANITEEDNSKILDIFDSTIVRGCFENPVAQCEEDYRKLKELVSNYSLSPYGEPKSERQGEWNGKTVVFDPNPQGIDSVSFNFEGGIKLDIIRNGRKIEALCGQNGDWIPNADYPLMDAASSESKVIKGYVPAKILGYEPGQPWLLSAAWPADNILQINARRMDLMCTVSQTFTFSAETASVRIHYHFLPGNSPVNPDVVLVGRYVK